METFLPSSSEIMSRRYNASASYDTMNNIESFGPSIVPSPPEEPLRYTHPPEESRRYTTHSQEYSPLMISCPQVCQHVSSCPFCTQFYKTNMLPYILIIIFLGLCVLLLAIKVLWT